MYLDERSNILLKELIRYPHTTNAELQEKFDLTRRQIDYSFQKINNWLVENSYPKIHRSTNGSFTIEPYLFQNLFQIFGNEEREKSKRYILSDIERANLIILVLATHNEELSLNHFISKLEVSKNTVLRDLKLVAHNLKDYELRLKYSRMLGYFIEGDEWNQRTALIFTMEHILKNFNGEEFLQRFLEVDENRVIQLRKKLEAVEEYLDVHFIDCKMQILPYILEMIFRRIGKGGTIKKSFLVDYSAISDTKEYQAVERLSEDEVIISEQERMYITLQLLISNVLPKQYLKFDFDEEPKLKLVLEQILSEFEKKSCIQLINKGELLEKLFIHMKPAYYRIKYHLTTDYSVLDKVKKEFESIHYIVKQSLDPLENFIGTEIPEGERAFITLFIAGHLIEVEEWLQTKTKAVIVCPNGISISRLMEQTLRKLFPKIFFYQAMGIREFEKTKLKYDIVFSSVPLETDKKFFFVHQLIDEKEQLTLRNRVLRSIYMVDENQISVDGILQLISSYAEIKDRRKLEKLLVDYLAPNSLKRTKVGMKNSKSLADLLRPEFIVCVKRVSSWHEAIEVASKPLLQSGAITESYIFEMKKQYLTLENNIILKNAIAIPHAETAKGVKQLGMSLLFMEEGLFLENGIVLHFVVVIATVDRDAHFKALQQLMELSGMDQELNDLKMANTPKKMHAIINQFVSLQLKSV